jgi:hypothetical protein
VAIEEELHGQRLRPVYTQTIGRAEDSICKMQYMCLREETSQKRERDEDSDEDYEGQNLSSIGKRRKSSEELWFAKLEELSVNSEEMGNLEWSTREPTLIGEATVDELFYNFSEEIDDE